MGINNFHKWVDATFGCTQKASRVDCEDLLVDMNSLVHGAARKANTPAQAHKLILKRLEGLLAGACGSRGNKQAAKKGALHIYKDV